MEENHSQDTFYREVNIYIIKAVCKGGGILSRKYDQKRYLLCCLKVGIKDISL